MYYLVSSIRSVFWLHWLERAVLQFFILPTGHSAIGLKWVLKVKKVSDGKIIKHNARLVVNGYAPLQGVDFDKVFAPVARMEIVLLLLAMAAHSVWQVHHMDVKSAFLNVRSPRKSTSTNPRLHRRQACWSCPQDL
jgi:hypothetical protein